MLGGTDIEEDQAIAVHELPEILSTMYALKKEELPYAEFLNILLAVSSFLFVVSYGCR